MKPQAMLHTEKNSPDTRKLAQTAPKPAPSRPTASAPPAPPVPARPGDGRRYASQISQS